MDSHIRSRSLLKANLLLFLWLAFALCPAESDSEPRPELTESVAYVSKECDHELMKINSLAHFELFMSHYKLVIEHKTKPKRGLLNLDKGLRLCFDSKDKLNALVRLIEQRHQPAGVCGTSYIDQLVDFHLKYLVRQPTQSESQSQQQLSLLSDKTKFAAHVFSLIAHQVALTCKSGLADRLAEAQRAHDCLGVVASFLPPDALVAADSEQTPSGDKTNSIRGLLENFKHVEDLALLTADHRQVATANLTSDTPYFELLLSPKILGKIEELQLRCRDRESHYLAMFGPIVSLAQIGYQVPDELVTTTAPKPEVLKCWLATAQLCQGLLRTHISVQKIADKPENFKRLVGIKFGPPPSDVLASVAASSVQLTDSSRQSSDTFEEIASSVVYHVMRGASLKGRMKARAANWARRFVASHIDMGAVRDESTRHFVEALTRPTIIDDDEDEPRDSSVSFNGQKQSKNLIMPSKLLTDDADFYVQSGSFFVHKGVAIILSSVVGICMSAVFIWLTLYMLVTSLKGPRLPDADGNFKETWQQLRDKRMKTIDDKIKGNSFKSKFLVYRSPSG